LREGKTEIATAAARPEAAGFVLAGGQSSRMGQDKALLLFAGRPLVEHALSILHQAGLPASIAGARPSARTALEAFAPVVEDAEPGLGPLAGICAALAATSARYAVFLPVDLPLLPPALIAFLLHHTRITRQAVTVPSVAGFDQTFPVVLDRALLPALKAALDARNGRCLSAFDAAAASQGQTISAVEVEFLAQSGQVTHPLGLPPVRWFLNLNSPGDVEQAEALSGRRIA
jgi:molybdopterin-guanine dinucleotide biosynthesis protein A